MGNETTDEIAARHTENSIRNVDIVRAAQRACLDAEDGLAVRASVAAAFLELSRWFHRQADEQEASARRGSKGMSTQYRQAAALVSGVGLSLQKPPDAIEENLNKPEPTPEPAPIQTVVEPLVISEPLPPEEIERRTDVHRQMVEYLKGDSEFVPAMPPASQPSNGEQPDPFSDPVPVAQMSAGPDVGRRLTVSELRLTQPDLPPPDHRSVSQLSEYSDCGLKYRLSHRTSGIVQTPAWWEIGGRAMHSAVEELELAQAAGQPAPRSVADQWKHHLGQAITDTFSTHPGLPMESWSAACGGAEGYTWWLVEGESMLTSYVDMRAELDRLDPGRRIACRDLPGQRVPMIEYPLSFTVSDPYGPSIRVDGFLDQAWVRGDAALEIVDMKFGSSTPADYFQLAVYALGLKRMTPGEVQLPTIYGRYWLGRKGQYTDSVDLLERHTPEEIEWRFRMMDAGDRQGYHMPRVSSYCRSCSVRGACPVGNK